MSTNVRIQLHDGKDRHNTNGGIHVDRFDIRVPDFAPRLTCIGAPCGRGYWRLDLVEVHGDLPEWAVRQVNRRVSWLADRVRFALDAATGRTVRRFPPDIFLELDDG